MKRILCVDDDPFTCELIKIYLVDAPYELAFAKDLAGSLQLAKSQHFDLYLIDERLPDGSGIDFAREIRTFDSRTPIIFHSASAYAQDIRKGLDAGAQAYITKPSDPDEVVKAIKSIIGT